MQLHYPAGIDIFNAMLKLAGCDDFRALIWVGLAGCAVTCYALLRWGGWFAVMGFLCNSGAAGWKFFRHFGMEFADYQEEMDWKSIMLSMFVTQRGLLYAIPAGLLLLAVWRAQWFREPEEAGAGGADAAMGAGGAVRDDAAVPPAYVSVSLRDAGVVDVDRRRGAPAVAAMRCWTWCSGRCCRRRCACRW